MTTVTQAVGAVSELDDTDRRLIGLLSAGHTVTDAAAAVGLSATTVYRRQRRPAFRAALTDARAASFRVPVAAAMAAVPKCVDRLVSIVQSDTAHPSSVIRAAEALLNAAFKLDEHVSVLTRLSALEGEVMVREADWWAAAEAEAKAYFAAHPTDPADPAIV
jgi:hypothetical protein